MGVTRQLEAKQKRSTHYLPLDVANKKPCGGVIRDTTEETSPRRSHAGQASATVGQSNPHNFYLRAQIRYILDNLDAIKPSRLRGKVQDRLRDLTNELRNSRGASFWPLSFAAICFCAFIFMVNPWAKTRVYCSTCAPKTSFRVLKSYNQRDFLLQRVVDGVPEQPEMRRFDEDSPLEMGFTLTYLKFEDRGSVWSVKGIDPYFRLLRDEHGMAVVPPNCTNALHKPVVCEGEPRW